METRLSIKCDIREAQAILSAASKIIEDAEEQRQQDREFFQVSAEFNSLSVYEWAQLPTDYMSNYTCIDSERNQFDIEVINTNYRKGFVCDICDKDQRRKHVYLYGTSDSREPYFCLRHYCQINQGSRFHMKGVL